MEAKERRPHKTKEQWELEKASPKPKQDEDGMPSVDQMKQFISMAEVEGEVCYVHIRPSNPGYYAAEKELKDSGVTGEVVDDGCIPKVLNFGGACIAFFKPVHKNQCILEIATSICNPGDNYNKLTARGYAAAGLLSGETVQIRLPQPGFYSRQVRELFKFMA